MSEETCPHCGAYDYQNVGEGTPRICVECGYDDENGTLSVCPGGMHPRDGSVACKRCLARVPRDVPGLPCWRSKRRTLVANSRRPLRRERGDQQRIADIDDVVEQWLREHPVASEDAAGVPPR